MTQLLKLFLPPIYFVKNKGNHTKKTILRLQANSLMSLQSQGWSWSLIWNDRLNLSTFLSDLLDWGKRVMIRQIITRSHINFCRAQVYVINTASLSRAPASFVAEFGRCVVNASGNHERNKDSPPVRRRNDTQEKWFLPVQSLQVKTSKSFRSVSMRKQRVSLSPRTFLFRDAECPSLCPFWAV